MVSCFSSSVLIKDLRCQATTQLCVVHFSTNKIQKSHSHFSLLFNLLNVIQTLLADEISSKMLVKLESLAAHLILDVIELAHPVHELVDAVQLRPRADAVLLTTSGCGVKSGETMTLLRTKKVINKIETEKEETA